MHGRRTYMGGSSTLAEPEGHNEYLVADGLLGTNTKYNLFKQM